MAFCVGECDKIPPLAISATGPGCTDRSTVISFPGPESVGVRVLGDGNVPRRGCAMETFGMVRLPLGLSGYMAARKEYPWVASVRNAIF